MKAVLKFNLDDIDDRMAHLRCLKSMDIALVLWEFYANIHGKLEDVIEDKTMSNNEFLDIIYKEFGALLEDHNVNIDELIQ